MSTKNLDLDKSISKDFLEESGFDNMKVRRIPLTGLEPRLDEECEEEKKEEEVTGVVKSFDSGASHFLRKIDEVSVSNGIGALLSKKLLLLNLPKDVYFMYSLCCKRRKITFSSFFLSLFNSYVAAHPDPSLEALVDDMKEIGIYSL